MEVTKISDITLNKQQQSITILATVASRGSLRTWKTDRYSGTRISGILCDDSGSIDFVCFTDAATKFDKVLTENDTFTFKHVKVGKPKKQYAKTKHSCEIYIEMASVIQKEDIPPFSYEETFEFVDIKDLGQEQNSERVTVIGRVIEMPSTPEKFFDSDILKIMIQDSTAKVQYSLIGNANKNLNFGLRDLLILSNIQHKTFGQLHCLDGRTGIRIVVPAEKQYKYHKYLAQANSSCIDMSPRKQLPTPANVENLQNTSKLASINTNISSTNLKDVVYSKCPLFKCNSRVMLLDNKLFKCNKCDKNYHVSSHGLKLKLEIGNDDSSKSLLIFNEKAEQFLNCSTEELARSNIIAINELERKILEKNYNFVVKPASTEGEFYVDSFVECKTQYTTNMKDSVNNKPLCTGPSTSQIHRLASNTISTPKMDPAYNNNKEDDGGKAMDLTNNNKQADKDEAMDLTCSTKKKLRFGIDALLD